MERPDWDKVERRLYESSTVAIKSFAAEHPDEEVCYFAFDSEPGAGYVLICFDTAAHSISEAKRQAEQAAGRMRQHFAGEWD